MERYNKVLSCLLAASVADAMGAATETMTTDQIIQRFGCLVTDFYTPADDMFAHDFPKGSVTDDFSLAYYTALSIIYHNGIIDDSTAKDALIEWSNSKYYNMAGPTTSLAIEKLKGTQVEDNLFHPFNENNKGSNGSAMKIAPVGLAANGDVLKAIKDAITICLPTHNNSTSLAGACAVAAAIAEATNETSTIESIYTAGLKGALYGEQYGNKYGKKLANPSVYKRMILAKAIASKYKGEQMILMQELSDYIGSGLSAAEAVPTAFGLFYGLNGDPEKCIISGVNIGADTDTVATIAGAIAGAYKEYKNEHFLQIINEVNGFNLQWVAEKLIESTEK